MGGVILCSKIIFFYSNIQSNNLLYTSDVIKVFSVTDVLENAKLIKAKAQEESCNIVVVLSDDRGMGYATGALNYKEYLSYNSFYDRRTTTYLQLKDNNINQNILLVEFKDNKISNFNKLYLNGNLVEYLRLKLNKQRYPNFDRRFIK